MPKNDEHQEENVLQEEPINCEELSEISSPVLSQEEAASQIPSHGCKILHIAIP